MTSFPVLPLRQTSDGDILNYSIYPIYPDTNLQNVLDYTLDLMSTWTDNYIWNLDPFTLALDSDTAKLHGRMELGEDSGVALDEWIVVGVFWNISKRFPNIVISIQDGDGEFLLIESALHLPDWLKPETAEKRVWIHNGELKIIPLKEFTAHDPPALSLEDALKHLTNAIKSEGTTASLFTDDKMNTDIQAKIKDFPKSLLEQRHIAKVMVPRLLAQVIHRNPQVISAGIQSFITRMTQFKKLREFKYFVPEDWVTVNIQFTRPLFAMIKSQKFNPPPSFPAKSLSAAERETYNLGMKLTCAFELLISSSSPWSEKVLELWHAEKERKVDDIALRGWEENGEEVSCEEWMSLSAEDIKRIMREDKGEEEQVREMIANLERFMEGESGFEGIDDGFDDEFDEFDSDDDEVS